MEEAGLTSYWTKDVVARRIKENRAIYNQSSQDTSNVNLSDGRVEVALRLKHLQGAYYLLFMGSAIAFMTLMIENFSQFSS
ncbi:hypothetical protein Pcinc_008323 [Petrolisthes cinctipes]|uniref:Uncharacterized protein n=1 Tax=Petrolisthes cinctipes TaxID=88211 RepID=A0AAE1KWL8_PETCI|nr:hypothetical protein Pcinc_008323 [Petrolisthes cinctipes]